MTLTKPWVGLLSNLVPVAIIPKDSYESQKEHPLGTGPFKFIRYDNAQQVCDVEGICGVLGRRSKTVTNFAFASSLT